MHKLAVMPHQLFLVLRCKGLLNIKSGKSVQTRGDTTHASDCIKIKSIGLHHFEIGNSAKIMEIQEFSRGRKSDQ